MASMDKLEQIYKVAFVDDGWEWEREKNGKWEKKIRMHAQSLKDKKESDEIID